MQYFQGSRAADEAQVVLKKRQEFKINSSSKSLFIR